MMRSIFVAILCVISLSVVSVRGDDVPAVPVQIASPVARHVVDLFATGYARGPNTIKDARRLYESLLSESKGDPRIEYAYGLILLKQLRNKDAITQFQIATKQTESPLWPAWQALIWSHFLAKDHASGFDRLKAFARLLAAKNDPAGLPDRQHSVEWIGEVIAALQKSADTVKQRALLLHEEEALQEILGPGLMVNYAAGKSSVNSLHAMMEEDLQETKEAALAKEEKEKIEMQAQVAKNLEASEQRREQIKKTNEELKKSLDEQLANYGKQLTRLERDYDFLQKRTLSISTSQLALNTESQLLAQQTSNASNATTRPSNQAVLAQAYEQRKTVIQAQLLAYQIELEQTLAAMMVVAQKGQIMVGQRMAIVQQYERATGQLVEQDAELNKWQDRLKKDGEKLKTPATGKTKPVASKVKQARSFRTYIDLDLNLERDRLLDTFGVAMADMPDVTK